MLLPGSTMTHSHGMAAPLAQSLFGALAGAAVGLIAGPIGAMTGAILGSLAGLAAFAVVRCAWREESLRQARIDALKPMRKLELPLQEE